MLESWAVCWNSGPDLAGVGNSEPDFGKSEPKPRDDLSMIFGDDLVMICQFFSPWAACAAPPLNHCAVMIFDDV